MHLDFNKLYTCSQNFFILIKRLSSSFPSFTPQREGERGVVSLWGCQKGAEVLCKKNDISLVTQGWFLFKAIAEKKAQTTLTLFSVFPLKPVDNTVWLIGVES